ncbi:MAG: hypothetical protein Q7U16_00685 [Agitococcus sp.]|nr:hypothetical protein [Agitococcus sp.]
MIAYEQLIVMPPTVMPLPPKVLPPAITAAAVCPVPESMTSFVPSQTNVFTPEASPVQPAVVAVSVVPATAQVAVIGVPDVQPVVQVQLEQLVLDVQLFWADSEEHEKDVEPNVLVPLNDELLDSPPPPHATNARTVKIAKIMCRMLNTPFI